jgi:hypothetical protein
MLIAKRFGWFCAAALVLAPSCTDNPSREHIGKTAAALSASSSPTIDTFVVYAAKSVSLGTGVHSLGGDIGVATSAGASPQLTVGTLDGLDVVRTVFAPSISVGNAAVVGAVDTNALQNSGGLVGTQATYPASMPPLPPALAATPGASNVTVAQGHQQTLSPGSFGVLTDNGTVFLNPGTYSFSSVALGNNAQLVAQPGGSTSVLIAGTLSTGTFAHLLPSGQPANALTISVSGSDGPGGPAASIGANTQVVSLLGAPNGTLSLGNNVQATGAFAGASFVAGSNVFLTYQNGFPNIALTLATPNPLSPLAPVLTGSNSVSLDPGASVVSGTVVAMGGGGLDADANAALNDVWSRGNVQLDLGVHVGGTLHATKVSEGPNVVVAATDSTPPFDPPQTLSWNVIYPSGPTPQVDVALGQTQTIAPGLYGSVEVDANATLNLSSGTYYVTSLNVEPQATVSLNQASGPVIIYVSTNLLLNGAFTASGAEPNLLIGYLGSQPVLVGSTFDGAIVAPAAQLQLLSSAGVNVGFFAAKDVVLGSQAKVQYRLPGALAAASTLNLACVNNKGSGHYEALFGYNNVTGNLASVPVGSRNQFSPAPAGQGQPEDFLPINVPGAFAVLFNGSPLTWTLAGGSTVASAQAPACPTTACSPACKRGQQCVGGQCVTECGDGLCGGDESCNTCPADCACAAGQVCTANLCATPVQCGVGWQCGSGTSFGVNVDCGACPNNGTCNHHLCQ